MLITLFFLILYILIIYTTIDLDEERQKVLALGRVNSK